MLRTTFNYLSSQPDHLSCLRSSPFTRLYPRNLFSLFFLQSCFLGPPLPAPGPTRKETLPTGGFLAPGQGRSLRPRGPEPSWAEPVGPAPRPAPAGRPALPPRALGAARRCSLAPGCLSSGSTLAPAPSAACGRGSQPIRSLAAPPPLCQQRGLLVPSLPAWGAPHPAESLTRLLSGCPQLRSRRCSLGAPPPCFLPQQLCPGQAAALNRTRFLPSFILSGNSHSSSAWDMPHTRPLRPHECGPRPTGKPLPSTPAYLPTPPQSLLSDVLFHVLSLAFNCSRIIFPVKGQSVAGSGGRFVTQIRSKCENRVRGQSVARVGVHPDCGSVWGEVWVDAGSNLWSGLIGYEA